MRHKILKDLEDVWALTQEELNDIDEKMRRYGNWCYSEGIAYTENTRIVNSTYGRKEDQEESFH